MTTGDEKKKEVMNFKVIKDYVLGKGAPEDERRLDDWLGRSKENERLLFGAELLYHEGLSLIHI